MPARLPARSPCVWSSLPTPPRCLPQVVVKSQILAGGRGLGKFTNGLQVGAAGDWGGARGERRLSASSNTPGWHVYAHARLGQNNCPAPAAPLPACLPACLSRAVRTRARPAQWQHTSVANQRPCRVPCAPCVEGRRAHLQGQRGTEACGEDAGGDACHQAGAMHARLPARQQGVAQGVSLCVAQQQQPRAQLRLLLAPRHAARCPSPPTLARCSPGPRASPSTRSTSLRR